MDRSFLATNHFLSLSRGYPPEKDPILRQVIPAADENDYDSRFVEDPLCEERFSPIPRLVRRYKDRALIHCTNRCFIHCRFCFRKRFWISGSDNWNITKTEFAKIAGYISSQHEIREVILSGGDPLCLDNKEIFHFVGGLDKIRTVDVIRLATRALSANPNRVSAKFVRELRL